MSQEVRLRRCKPYANIHSKLPICSRVVLTRTHPAVPAALSTGCVADVHAGLQVYWGVVVVVVDELVPHADGRLAEQVVCCCYEGLHGTVEVLDEVADLACDGCGCGLACADAALVGEDDQLPAVAVQLLELDGHLGMQPAPVAAVERKAPAALGRDESGVHVEGGDATVARNASGGRRVAVEDEESAKVLPTQLISGQVVGSRSDESGRR